LGLTTHYGKPVSVTPSSLFTTGFRLPLDVTCWRAAMTTTLSTIGDRRLAKLRNERFLKGCHVIYVRGHTSFLVPWLFRNRLNEAIQSDLCTPYTGRFLLKALEPSTYPTSRCNLFGRVKVTRPTKAFHMDHGLQPSKVYTPTPATEFRQQLLRLFPELN